MVSALVGLYVITPDQPLAQYREQLLTVLRARPALLQYRRKNVSDACRLEEARSIQALMHTLAASEALPPVPLIINDALWLAETLGCGLHQGQGDGSLSEARQRLGPNAIIGRTCHQSQALAEQAIAEGASYLAFGAVYPSRTKPLATRIDPSDLLALIQQVTSQSQHPVCAIGGLQPENAQVVRAAGAQLLAVSQDIWSRQGEALRDRLAEWRRVFL